MRTFYRGTHYYVYIMTNKAGTTIYTGVTNDIKRRVHEHRDKSKSGFASKYNLTRLVYCEATPYIDVAITREKQIKRWSRVKKLELIQSDNPQWHDLSAEWS